MVGVDSTYSSVFEYDPSFEFSSSQTIDINFDFNNPYFESQHWKVISFTKKELIVEYTDLSASFSNAKITLKKQ